MNKQKILAQLKQSFMVKRYKAQEECESFISELREDGEFNKIYMDYTKKQLEYAKAELIEESLRMNAGCKFSYLFESKKCWTKK